jgi:hypothetical protein
MFHSTRYILTIAIQNMQDERCYSPLLNQVPVHYLAVMHGFKQLLQQIMQRVIRRVQLS